MNGAFSGLSGSQISHGKDLPEYKRLRRYWLPGHIFTISFARFSGCLEYPTLNGPSILPKM